jgi:dTDP-4-dehydrorhamnose reductase
MKYYRNNKEVSKEEMLSQLKEEQKPAPILYGPNAQAILEAAKRRMESTTYTITEHDTGQKYTITEHKQEQPKQEKSTDELIAEARKYLPRQPTKQEIEKEKQQKEFERSVQEWRKYYSENQGKIPNTFPKSFFDKDESKE